MSSISQNSITHSDFTEFLASGALLRDQQQCTLLLGPFSASDTDKKQEISVCCPFFYETERLSFLRPTRVITLPAMDFARICLRFVESEGTSSPTALSWEPPRKDEFEKGFARIQNLIQQGQIDKAVPVVFARSTGEVSPLMKARMLLELMSVPETLWVYGFWNADQGILGATPEVLFASEGRRLRTMALAGTLAKGDGRESDLLRSAKDQHEHALVVQDLKQELKSLGHVRIRPTGILDLPSLWHLKTDFELDLHEDLDVARMLKTLHPTAALGVFPRLFGWRWMRELPGQEDRARYGAPMTFRLSDQKVISLVAIRNLQWGSSRIVLGSGCGIVGSSELEAEWNELARKRESVMRLLGLIK